MASFRNILATAPKARVTFSFAADDGQYRSSVPGIPSDYTLDSLREHLKGKDVVTSTKVDGRTYAAVPKGERIVPFLVPAEDAVPEPVRKRAKGSVPAPSTNGDHVSSANGESK